MDDGATWWGDPKLLEDEPLAVSTADALGLIFERGSPQVIVDTLEALWMSVDRASLWLASQTTAWQSEATTLAERTCLLTLPTLVGHVRAVTVLARAGLANLPTALLASRSAFEIGLRVAWVFTDNSDHRAVLLHDEKRRLKEGVADRLARTNCGDGMRWRRSAGVHERFVNGARSGMTDPPAIERVPSVLAQLRDLNLERLYLGYQLSSEHVHGGIASGGEILAVTAERSPYGTYWPQDWHLPISQCAWALLFVSQHYPAIDLDVGPVRGAMWAADVLLRAPGGVDEEFEPDES